MNKCIYKKSNGEQCKSYAMRNSKFCFTHNPDTKRERASAVSKGGKSPRKNYLNLKPVKIKNPKQVVTLLEDTINKVRGGDMDIRVANCIGYLSGHIIKAIEISDLEKRLEIMEDKINDEI